MRFTAPPTGPTPTTRLQCDRTKGYTVKAGVHGYEWCPFCGHRVLNDDRHELSVDLGR